MSEIRAIGDIVSYNREKDYEFHTTTGEVFNCAYAFFVPEKSPKKQHQNAENWSKTRNYGNNNNTTPSIDTLENRFKRVYFEDAVKSRMSRKVAGIALETENGEYYRIEIDLDELVTYVIPLFNISNGIIEEEVRMAKVGSRWTPVPYNTDVMTNEEKAIETKQRITKTKLKVGTRYITTYMDRVYLGRNSQNEYVFGDVYGDYLQNWYGTLELRLYSNSSNLKLFGYRIGFEKVLEFVKTRTDIAWEHNRRNPAIHDTEVVERGGKFIMGDGGNSNWSVAEAIRIKCTDDLLGFSSSTIVESNKAISMDCTKVVDCVLSEEVCAEYIDAPDTYNVFRYRSDVSGTNVMTQIFNMPNNDRVSETIFQKWDKRFDSFMDDLKDFCKRNGTRA